MSHTAGLWRPSQPLAGKALPTPASHETQLWRRQCALDKASLPCAWLFFDSCHSCRVQGTVDSLCLLHGMPSSSLSCPVMPKPMGSGDVTSVLSGLE